MDNSALQVIITAAIIILVVILTMAFSYTMGQEKSYEEALAERRQLLSNIAPNHQAGKKDRKEKKNKKANKKEKKKQSEEEEDDDAEATSSHQAPTNQKLHVEFTEEPIVVEENSTDQLPDKPSTSKQKRGKKDKVRPILIHKPVENPVIIDPIDVPPANHFEQLHPKDEFELLHSHLLHTKEDITPKLEVPKEKPQKPKQSATTTVENIKEKSQQNKLRPLDKENKPKQSDVVSKDKDVKEKAEPLKEKKDKTQLLETAPKERKPTPSPNSPESQKQKKIAKQTAQAQLPSNKEKEESLGDLISAPPQIPEAASNVNKEKKKKKAGPREENPILSQIKILVRNPEFSHVDLQSLINFLLNMQQDNPKESPEWSEGKKDLVEKLKKQLNERDNIIDQKQEDIQNAHAKLRAVRNELTAERINLQQKFRELEEAFRIKEQELHVANSNLHAQVDTINRLNTKSNEDMLVMKKTHDENAALKLKLQQADLCINQIREAEATIQELKNCNNQLSMELHTLNDQTKERQQGLIVQINRITNELEDKANYARKLEEIKCDLEQRLGLAHRQENEMKVKISELQNAYQQQMEDIRLLEQGKLQVVEDMKNLQKQNDNFENIVSQLKKDLKDAQVNLAANANGVAQENEIHKEQLTHLQNELSNVTTCLQTANKKLDVSEHSIKQLEKELSEQKDKNNELRKKNWKVMDALNAAESQSVVMPKKSADSLDEITLKVRLEEQDATKKFFQRLFPDIQIHNNLPYDQWAVHVEKAIQDFVVKLEKPEEGDNENEISKLQDKVKMYKEIISKTETILKEFEKRLADEEVCWRTEVQEKEDEIAVLKQKFASELQAKVQQMELELNKEREEKAELVKSYTQLKNMSSVSNSNAASTAQLLTEEISSAKTETLKQLHRETNDVTNVSSKEHNGNSTNGTPLQIS